MDSSTYICNLSVPAEIPSSVDTEVFIWGDLSDIISMYNKRNMVSNLVWIYHHFFSFNSIITSITAYSFYLKHHYIP